jgi:hypothetical protein
MRAHYPSVRSISGDSVAGHRMWLFPFTSSYGVVPPNPPLVFDDLFRTPSCDGDALSQSPLVLPHGLLGPLLRVLPSLHLRCLFHLALLTVRLLWLTTFLLHVEEALVERGDISSMVHPEDIGSSPSSAPTWIIFDFSTNENHFF